MKDEASKTVESVKSVKSVINKNTDRTIKPSLLDIEISAKTFVIAHSSILLVGLIICFGLYYYLYRTESLSQIKNLAPLTQAPKSFILEINNPEDDDLVFDKS